MRQSQDNSSSATSSGIGFTGALTIVFIVLKLLKLGGVENWSWWWVFSPLWIGFLVWLLIVAIFVVIFWWANKR